ncbi:MAG: hypothetical protein F4013_08470 [Gammaproteobacteria bacterium]|nr:hypothetical protein [Gammaproteobacteria bacterium]
MSLRASRLSGRGLFERVLLVSLNMNPKITSMRCLPILLWAALHMSGVDASHEPEAAAVNAAEEEQAAFDVERVYSNQEGLVQLALDKVRASEEGVAETYFVGFGSSDAQDVFENEVKLVEAQFREQLGAEGRTAMLINSRNTIDDLPLANGRNLAAVLSGIGRKMGPEDLLVLHMTSHGSRKHRFDVSFKPFRLRDLSAKRIGEIVDGANLPWRVVVVSACFSGGYIEALKSPRTMVITAASARRESFGCENGRDYTYFGEAFYRDSLTDGDYRAAFRRAVALVRKRERSKGFRHSRPQLWVGEEIEDKLPLMPEEALNLLDDKIAPKSKDTVGEARDVETPSVPEQVRSLVGHGPQVVLGIENKHRLADFSHGAQEIVAINGNVSPR